MPTSPLLGSPRPHPLLPPRWSSLFLTVSPGRCDEVSVLFQTFTKLYENPTTPEIPGENHPIFGDLFGVFECIEKEHAALVANAPRLPIAPGAGRKNRRIQATSIRKRQKELVAAVNLKLYTLIQGAIESLIFAQETRLTV